MGKKFESFNVALEEMEKRNYEEATYNTSAIVLKDDETVEVGGASYKYTGSFLDALFKITKLPKGNANILPMDNVILDLNTLLQRLELDVRIRFLDRNAYTLFPSNKGSIKIPLNYYEFLDLVQSVVDTDTAEVYDADSFLRVIYMYPNTNFKYENEEGEENFSVGMDIIMGETLKSPPITINLILRNESKSIVVPFLESTIKINPNNDQDKIIREFERKVNSLRVDYDLLKSRFDKIYTKPLNDELVRVLFKSSGFLPVDLKNFIFSEYFLLDENLKMTSVVNKQNIEEKELIGIMSEVLQVVSNNRNDLITNENAYKADTVIGSMFSENNKKFNNAFMA